MSVYMVIENKEITNKETALEYVTKARPIIESFGGKYLASSEDVKALSGLWKPKKIIIIEFPSKEKFDACFESDEYKAIVQLRLDSIVGQSILVPSL